jgi:aromatic ring hydroxylase
MGCAPDFMNQFVTGWHLMADRFARGGARFGENATRYYEHVREHDLFLTHMLINPQIDRSKTSAQQEDPFLHLGRSGETREGIIVRGAKMLGPMAPITEEVAVVPFGGVPPGDDAYALIGITGFLHVQEKLGEMLSHMEVARAVFYGAEAMAQPLPGGVWVPGGPGLRAFHLQSGKVYTRFVEIVQTLAAGGFFYAPSAADLDNPEVRPYIDKYVRGRASPRTSASRSSSSRGT